MSAPRSYSRHGLNPIRKHIMVNGFETIDKRSTGARALFEWRKDLVADLGGESAISAQQRALIEVATRTRFYVDHLDAFLMQQKSLVNAKRKAVLPVLRERQGLVDSLARMLAQLGLERKARPIKSLDAHIAETYGSERATTETS